MLLPSITTPGCISYAGGAGSPPEPPVLGVIGVSGSFLSLKPVCKSTQSEREVDMGNGKGGPFRCWGAGVFHDADCSGFGSGRRADDAPELSAIIGCLSLGDREGCKAGRLLGCKRGSVREFGNCKVVVGDLTYEGGLRMVVADMFARA